MYTLKLCIYVFTWIIILPGPGAQPSTVRTSGTSVNEELTSFPANISFPIIDDEVALETVERYSLSLIPSDPSITINQFMSEIVILDDDGKLRTLYSM